MGEGQRESVKSERVKERERKRERKREKEREKKGREEERDIRDGDGRCKTQDKCKMQHTKRYMFRDRRTDR